MSYQVWVPTSVLVPSCGQDIDMIKAMIKGSGYPVRTCTANFEYAHAIHNDILLNDFTWDIGDTVLNWLVKHRNHRKRCHMITYSWVRSLAQAVEGEERRGGLFPSRRSSPLMSFHSPALILGTPPPLMSFPITTHPSRPRYT